ncbi:MAG: tyrosine-type recombinase/integrase [gamma proteobacterium symbiont of Taylorina sp.]|nr:tyrosine-type recombinase/integrase [gamma proteobacterium symbiont of Taylorina sp.]
MGRKKTPGLTKRGEMWHIDKRVNGTRIVESTRTGSLDEAEKYLNLRISQIRSATIYGERPKYTFVDAASRYLKENMNNKSIAGDASRIKGLVPFIGNLALANIHDGTMQPYIDNLRDTGRKSKTVNNGLEITRRIMKKAATKWRDNLTGKTWIAGISVIENVDWKDTRKPYPITWAEQKYLIHNLAGHLIEPVLFALNTGCREQEVCQLRWEWEVKLPELNTSVFILPDWFTKNSEERVVVLNSVSLSVINSQRGNHPSRVFTYLKGRKGEKVREPLDKIYNSGWKTARTNAAKQYEKEMKDDAPWGFSNLRVHDLRHTFGRRLRSASVTKETRSALLGHKTGDITTHYSGAEIQELIDAVMKIAETDSRKSPALTLLRSNSRQ